MPASLTSLLTTVRNVSGTKMFFPFLPPHGRTLPANGQVAIPGNVLEWAQQFPAKAKGLRYALLNNLIEVHQTPQSVLYDADQQLPQVLTVDNGAVEVAHPSWNQP